MFQLLEQSTVNVAFASLFCHEVPEMANFCLTNSMNSAKPLLNTIWIPRQVVVHHQVCALEIYAFSRGVRRD